MSETNKYASFRAQLSGDDGCGMWGTHDPSPQNATLKYCTNHPLEAVMQPNYFLSVRSCFWKGHVRPGENPYREGDTIVVTCLEDDGGRTEAWLKVDYVDENCVTTVPMPIFNGEISFKFGGQQPDLALDAKHVGAGKWRLFYTATGKPYRAGALFDKMEAERLVGHPIGKGAETEAA